MTQVSLVVKFFCVCFNYDHLLGLFRGAAHTVCNLNLKKLVKTPVFFHNGSRYDNHHLIKTLAEESERLEKRNIEVIGKTMEKFTTLTWENFEFKEKGQRWENKGGLRGYPL